MINLFGYRVSWAQLAWFGHRASGLGVLFYLFLHIVETSTVLFGPDVYDAAVGIFKNLPARLGEVLLMAALVYHALNGIRVILIDFWQHGPRYQRLMLWGVAAIWLAVMIPALGVLGMHMAERFL